MQSEENGNRPEMGKSKAAKPAKTRKTGKILLGAVALIAIAAAGGAVVYKPKLEKEIETRLLERGAQVASVDVSYMGRLHLRDLKFPLKDKGQITIANVSGRPSILFLRGELEATDVDVSFDGINVVAPRIELNSVDMSRQTLSDIFTSKSGKSLSERVKLFSAGKVDVPELRVRQDSGSVKQDVVYKGIVFNNIDNGKIGSYKSSGSTFDVEVLTPDSAGNATEHLTGSIGESQGKDINIGYAAQIYSEKADPQNNRPQLLYGPLSVKDMRVEGQDGLKIVYGELSTNGFSMSLLPEPLWPTLRKLQEVTDIEKLSAEDRQAYFNSLLAIFEAFSSGDFEARNVQIIPGKMPSNSVRSEGSIDRLFMKFANNGFDMGMDGFTVRGDDKSYIKLDKFSIDGFSWASTLEGLRKLAGWNVNEIDRFPFVSLMPWLGTIRMTGLEGDVPADKDNTSRAGLAEKIKFSLAEYALETANPVNGLPSSLRVATKDLAMVLPENSDDQTIREMRQLGFNELVFSSATDLAWDEKTQVLKVQDISLNIKDMGSMAFSAAVGGFSKDFFSGDKVLMQVALLGLKAQSADLKLVDEGLLGILIKKQAAETGVPEKELRTMLATLPLDNLNAMISDPVQRQRMEKIARAFAEFIEKSGSFNLSLKSKSEKGLGLFEMISASQNPESLLNKIDIEVTVN